jgi:hypothetical protein
MTTTSSKPDVTAEWLVPARADGCQCKTPWRDGDSCLRCGHWVQPAVEELPRKRRSSVTDNPWTAAGVLRAIRTFEFFLDRMPTTTDWSAEDDPRWPSVATVVRLFGSFDAAVHAARWSPARSAAA